MDYLEAEHEAVQALGISAEVARTLGIGYAPKGTMVKRDELFGTAQAIHDRK